MSNIVSLLSEGAVLLFAFVVGLVAIVLLVLAALVLMGIAVWIWESLEDSTPETVKDVLAVVAGLVVLGFVLVLSFGVGEALIKWASGIIG